MKECKRKKREYEREGLFEEAFEYEPPLHKVPKSSLSLSKKKLKYN